jgi:hypothetical protein
LAPGIDPGGDAVATLRMMVLFFTHIFVG